MERVEDVMHIQKKGCEESFRTSITIKDVENPMAKSIVFSILQNAHDSETVAESKIQNRIRSLKD